MLNPAYKFDILSLDDPFPGVKDTYRSITRLVAKMRQANRQQKIQQEEIVAKPARR
jgi:hypothetical protein